MIDLGQAQSPARVSSTARQLDQLARPEQCADVEFDLHSILEARRGSGYELYAQYLNPQLPRVLRAIGLTKCMSGLKVPTCMTATVIST
jgi:hypothetical protein